MSQDRPPVSPEQTIQTIQTLAAKLAKKQKDLKKRETSCGTHHNVRKMNQLRLEIASLRNKLDKAERALDVASRDPNPRS